MSEFLAVSVLACVAGSLNFAILVFRMRELGDPYEVVHDQAEGHLFSMTAMDE
jgi:hypothetical protein